MSKCIVTEREVRSCEFCDYRRSQISLIERFKRAALNNYDDPSKCTRKRPHKPIPDNDTIPEWCPLPDWT